MLKNLIFRGNFKFPFSISFKSWDSLISPLNLLLISILPSLTFSSINTVDSEIIPIVTGYMGIFPKLLIS